MATIEEFIEVERDLNIASYTTVVPTLILWIWVFVRMQQRKKERSKFFVLTVICVLMIIS